MILKNNQTTEDPRLDRVVLFDERSKAFPIRATIEQKKPRSYTWRCMEWFDQGREGKCVAYGIGHELAARPSEITGLTPEVLQNIYWQAQRNDPWPGGSYPGAQPFYDGTAVLAGVKEAQSLGYFGSYRWSFSLAELNMGLSYAGPAVLGLAWYEGMFNTDSQGYIRVTGQVTGGHCVCARGVDIKNKRILIRNSWSATWGINGDAWITFDDMDRLLHEQGEACFFLDRKKAPRRSRVVAPLS